MEITWAQRVNSGWEGPTSSCRAWGHLEQEPYQLCILWAALMGGMTVQGFTRMIFETCEKIPGTLRIASKSYFFQKKLLKNFFSYKNKVIFSRCQWLIKISFKSYLQGLG